MAKNNDFNYGTMTNIDVNQIKLSLKYLKTTFKDNHINLLEIGLDKGKTTKSIYNELSELGIRNYTYWGIDNNPKTKLPFKDFKMIIGKSEDVFNQLPKLHWVLIDGCHCSNHVMLDFLNYGYKVVKNGFLLFHDTSFFSQGHHYQKHGPKELDFYIATERAFKKLDIFNRVDWEHIGSDYDKKNIEWGGISIFKKIKNSEKIIDYKSKEGQDKWVIKKLNNKKNGYFIDVGASGGVTHSNTYALEKDLNWTGICVEPNPNFRSFQSLKKNRNCICENLCIYDKNGMVDFVARGRRIESSGIYGDCSNVIIKDLVNKKKHPIIKVHTITLLELLEKHNSPHTIDYISIDTEGSEFKILKNFNFDKYIFLTITVEHNYWKGTNWDKKEKIKRNKIRKLLLNKGYVIDIKLPWEDWFVHKSIYGKK